MTQFDVHQTPAHRQKSGQSGHRWMMIAWCIPMFAIAIVLVGTGIVSAGFIIVAVGCMAMMALMMRGMSHRNDGM